MSGYPVTARCIIHKLNLLIISILSTFLASLTRTSIRFFEIINLIIKNLKIGGGMFHCFFVLKGQKSRPSGMGSESHSFPKDGIAVRESYSFLASASSLLNASSELRRATVAAAIMRAATISVAQC